MLEEAHPEVHDVISPDVARTMTAMLEEVVQFGTAMKAKALGRPAAGKTGTTQDFTDAWFMGFTPQLTAGVWVGYDDKQISLGKRETGAHAALPIWIEFMEKDRSKMCRRSNFQMWSPSSNKPRNITSAPTSPTRNPKKN